MTRPWVATSDRFGTVLRGTDQEELDEARWDHLIHLTDELRQIFRETPGQGDTPPPPHP
jgi:hypothetical protein